MFSLSGDAGADATLLAESLPDFGDVDAAGEDAKVGDTDAMKCDSQPVIYFAEALQPCPVLFGIGIPAQQADETVQAVKEELAVTANGDHGGGVAKSSGSDDVQGKTEPTTTTTAAGSTQQQQTVDSAQRQQRELFFIRQLQALLHASKCPAPAGCTPPCAQMKALLAHIKECQQIPCDVLLCVQSKRLLMHFRQCSDQTCNVCVTVRSQELNATVLRRKQLVRKMVCTVVSRTAW